MKGKNKHVELIGKNISDLNAKELGAAIKSYPVKTLDLSGNSLTDEGLKVICRALCESGIEKVNLAKNKIGEKHIDQIIQILKTSKSSLRQIVLLDNQFVSKMSKNRIKNSLAKAGSGGRGIEIVI